MKGCLLLKSYSINVINIRLELGCLPVAYMIAHGIIMAIYALSPCGLGRSGNFTLAIFILLRFLVGGHGRSGKLAILVRL